MYNNEFFPASCKSLWSKITYCTLCFAFTMATTCLMFWFLGMG